MSLYTGPRMQASSGKPQFSQYDFGYLNASSTGVSWPVPDTSTKAAVGACGVYFEPGPESTITIDYIRWDGDGGDQSGKTITFAIGYTTTDERNTAKTYTIPKSASLAEQYIVKSGTSGPTDAIYVAGVGITVKLSDIPHWEKLRAFTVGISGFGAGGIEAHVHIAVKHY